MESGTDGGSFSNKSRLKWLILTLSLAISTGTIYYTDVLVDQLKMREKQQVELFAKALEYTINEESGSNIYFITDQILFENKSVPTILTDTSGTIMDYRNITIDSARKDVSRIQSSLESILVNMKETYDPIPVSVRDPSGKMLTFGYVYYNDSKLLIQLTYYPYVQLAILAVIGFVAYLAFNYSRSAEQNRLWVGLAKETAHQLGTPISSLMAWQDFLDEIPEVRRQNITQELDKDIKRLQLITERFSSIGSTPVLKVENLNHIIENTINYLSPRISKKVKINFTSLHEEIECIINAPLFEWVLENLIKNAVDAMEGIGNITISMLRGSDYRILIDITDTGKGIQKGKINQVFSAGFTTKKRGWGLGLALAKRIINNYHGGRIFVKSSEENVGTTFRIVLPSP